LQILADKMIRLERAVRIAGRRPRIDDAQQHFRHAAAAGESGAAERIGAGSELAVEEEVVLVIGMLPKHLLHAGGAEVQGVFPVYLDEVTRQSADRTVVGHSMLIV